MLPEAIGLRVLRGIDYYKALSSAHLRPRARAIVRGSLHPKYKPARKNLSGSDGGPVCRTYTPQNASSNRYQEGLRKLALASVAPSRTRRPMVGIGQAAAKYHKETHSTLRAP